MYKQLIINVTEHETRVALLEDGTIVEIHVDRGDDSDIAGNIYKGRVLRVLPGMQAAFVDIGLHQAAFIYVDDVANNNFKDIERMLALSAENGEGPTDEEALPSPPARERGLLIEELLVEGQEVLVQVAKSPIGTKGARIPPTFPSPAGFWC